MTIIGYARVSTNKQDISLQIDALEKFGVSKIYSEKLSGTKSHKTELHNAINELQEGDTLVVYRVDRLSRSLRDLLDIVSELTLRGILLKVIEQSMIDISTPEGRMQFYISAIISEYEREILSARTRDGLEAARARGRFGGRKPKLSYEQKVEIKKLYDAQELTVREIANMFSISSPTVYRCVEYISAQNEATPTTQQVDQTRRNHGN